MQRGGNQQKAEAFGARRWTCPADSLQKVASWATNQRLIEVAKNDNLMLDPSALADTFAQLFDLRTEERRHLHSLAANTEEFPPRRKLITEARPSQRLFILTAGWLFESKLLRNGDRQILNFRLPGDIIGIECLAFREALHSTTTLTHCTVAPLSVESLERTQREFPRLAAALFLMTLRDGVIRHEWEVNIGRRTALARCAHLFAELDRRIHERRLSVDGAVPMPLTQEEIADCTGLTPPYVNRMLQMLRVKGLIRFESKVLEILDRVELAKIAGFDPYYIEGWGKGGSRLGSN
jgi:CRP-like cAMP-binding protein